MLKPRIRINYKKTDELCRKLWKYYMLFTKDNYERSDLIYCPLKAYNRMTNVPIRKLPNKAIATFLVGQTLHVLIQNAFPKIEVKEELMPNLIARVDIMWDKPTEIKTTTMSMYTKEHIPMSYIEQLAAVLAFRGENSGYLITLDILNKTLLVWDVAFKQKQLNEFKRILEDRYQRLQKAVQEKSFSGLTPKVLECDACLYGIENCALFRRLRNVKP